MSGPTFFLFFLGSNLNLKQRNRAKQSYRVTELTDLTDAFTFIPSVVELLPLQIIFISTQQHCRKDNPHLLTLFPAAGLLFSSKEGNSAG